MMILILPSAEEVAIEFCRQLSDALTERQMEEVIIRNRMELDSRICHSHDFCDSNVLMNDALENLGVQTSGGDRDRSDWDVMDIWNTAWAIAKAAEFDSKKIVKGA